MREILFRGKRVDNGEWIEGNLYESKMSGCYILIPQIKVRRKDGVVIGDTFTVHEVAHETIGQFTGLYDKNGKRIFEGDIVSQNRNGFETLYVTIFTDKDVGSCGCCYPSFDGIGFVFESVKGTRANVFDMYPLEVVGNIHDNKEMLTGQ